MSTLTSLIELVSSGRLRLLEPQPGEEAYYPYLAGRVALELEPMRIGRGPRRRGRVGDDAGRCGECGKSDGPHS